MEAQTPANSKAEAAQAERDHYQGNPLNPARGIVNGIAIAAAIFAGIAWIAFG